MQPVFKHSREDLLELLDHMLQRIEGKERKAKAQNLLREAEASVQIYRKEKAHEFKRGEVRKSLLKLWKAAESTESAEVLIELLVSSAPGTIEYLFQRVPHVLPSLTLGLKSSSDLLNWAKTAAEKDLQMLLMRCCADGRQFIEGRNRPGSKQSAGSIQPTILGLAEGASGKRLKKEPLLHTPKGLAIAEPASEAGRSTVDAEVGLVVALANDWYRTTGHFVAGGRSDHNPMVEFISSVFEWAKIGGCENALRIYWSELKNRKRRSAPDIRCADDPASRSVEPDDGPAQGGGP